MDRAVYQAMAAEEDEHWWFVGRRAVLSALIRRRAAPPPGSDVLDMGCGSGGNMPMLAEFGRLQGIEYDAPAREIAASRGVAPVAAGGLPDGLDVPDGKFALIGLFDVLEHVEQDVASVAALGQKLAPDGRLVISVPALPWLWSDHDVTHHHFRRYTRARRCAGRSRRPGCRSMGSAISTRSFSLSRWRSGWCRRPRGSARGRQGLPTPAVNAALKTVFGWERHLIGRVPLPIGLSLWAVIRK